MLKRIKAIASRRSLDSVSLSKIKRLENITGCFIYTPALFLRALRHKSTLVEADLGAFESYEQLEFLGDAVLDLVVTEMIFEHFPKETEGFMTKLRSKLVKEDMLSFLSKKLDLPKLIEVGERVKGQNIHFKNSVLCDVFESVIGAIYLDNGLDCSRRFIKNVYNTHVDIQKTSSLQDNYKSILLEFSQKEKMGNPEYVVLSEVGPDHDKLFKVGVVINGDIYGTGKAKNKKRAEQAAAKMAIENFNATFKN